MSDGIKSIDCFFHIQSFLNKLHSVYSHSAKLQRQLKAIAAEKDTEIMKIGKVFDVRWVASSSRAVNALWTDFPALFFHFSKLAEDGSIKSNERATFKGLATKLSTIQFIEDLALIRDCLSVISELSETLQKRKTNMIVANKHIQWTIRSLQLIKQSLVDGKYSFQKIVGDGEKNSKVLRST